ncbi:uncharacterized protein BYT42DRAFT_555470 [Radiomyces spectabilis]|uniref:uncharacterized protein n=1 Tax=Radiomyces spectabilis TaxID=64574 RepID=UPI002220B641|nr:uncharacterized protein BYT42DRAFT_555470 [Radiomyces spectabilis]KAI8391067.1 hypothetical protein BYT42DRAFT_555470 [Radiomyces spectabilis]
MGRSESDIYSVIKPKKVDEVPAVPKRVGRPPKLDDRDKRAILRYMKMHPRTTLGEITSNSPCKVGPDTVRRMLLAEKKNSRSGRMKP